MSKVFIGGSRKISRLSTDVRRRIDGIIEKRLPVLHCGNCGEFLMEDPVMERVEAILGGVQQGAELEVVHYAA